MLLYSNMAGHEDCTYPEHFVYSPLFVADELIQMKRGKVSLHVPLVDNVIQIGSPPTINTGEISVKKGWRGISVQNVDGTPLQAEIVDNTASEAATSVFVEPVTELKFRKKRDLFGRPCWFADGEGVNVADKSAITRFAKVIGILAVRKQGGTIISKVNN